jgi:nitrate/nitrite transport system ATP-binding protein
MDKYLQIENIRMTFTTRKTSFVAITGIDLSIRKGEFVSLIGHSGCGKSTLLNLVAGLMQPTEGTMILAEREIAGPGPDRGVVFQNHSLLPWLTCFGNVHLAVERVFGGSEPKAKLKARDSGRAGARRSHARAGQAAARNLGRHEAACGYRPRARHRAQGAAARRALRRARCADPRDPCRTS